MYLLGFLSVIFLISVPSTMAFSDRLRILRLQCELIYGNDNALDTGEKDENSRSGCVMKDKISCNKRGSLKCVKVASERLCKRFMKQKEPCSETTSVKAPDVRPRCILLKRENVKVRQRYQLIKLNMKLEPEMKLIVYGGSAKGAARSYFTQGLIIHKAYNGDFPITDRTHFSMAFLVAKSDIKIYADKVPVKTIESIPGLREFNIRYYSGIHVLVVQKTGEECQNVPNGIL